MSRRKFGKKNIVKVDPLAYNLGLFGESGVGKTQLAVETCEKLVGEDGYILLNIGKEDGIDAIQGAIYEDVKTWSDFDEIVNDIVKYKNEDYKDLKIVVLDTIDELDILGKEQVIKLYNKTNPKKGRANTFNQAFGGFSAPHDKLWEIISDNIWKLKSVGVNVFIIGHIKRRTKFDPVSATEYDIITSKISNNLFDNIKTKLHVLGLAHVNREVESEIIGQDIMGKDKTINVTKSEKRIITFRDDNFTVDSKSRFADIIPRIELNSDKFIEAITTAIQKAFDKKDIGKSIEQAEKEQKKDKEIEVNKNIEELSVDKNEIVEELKLLYKNSDSEKQNSFKKEMKALNLSKFDELIEVEKEILDNLTEILK